MLGASIAILVLPVVVSRLCMHCSFHSFLLYRLYIHSILNVTGSTHVILTVIDS